MKKLLLACLCYCAYGFGATALITEPNDGIGPLLDAINHAQQTIDITMYGFTNQNIARALIKAKQRGVNVKVLMEPSPYKQEHENDAITKKLIAGGVIVHPTSSHFRLTHQKTILIDDSNAFIMTMNLTYHSLFLDRNFAIETDDRETISRLQNLFSCDWEQQAICASSSLIISPENSRDQITQFIMNTTGDLDLYEQSITDPKILELLCNKAMHNRVRILLSKREQYKHASQIKNLIAHGAFIHFISKPYIHAKVIISHTPDKILLGSINLTTPSLDQNREVGVIVDDGGVYKQMAWQFNRDWSTTR